MVVVVIAAACAIAGGALLRRGATRWLDREATIAMKTEQIGHLRALLAHEDAIRDTVHAIDARRAARPRPLVARSAAAAGADVQSFVQEQAALSLITVNSLDVAGEVDRLGDIPMVPITVSAIGDIHGVAAWLDRLQYGPRVLEIRELTITPNPALRGNLLQLSMTLRAPYVAAPSVAAP